MKINWAYISNASLNRTFDRFRSYVWNVGMYLISMSNVKHENKIVHKKNLCIYIISYKYSFSSGILIKYYRIIKLKTIKTFYHVMKVYTPKLKFDKYYQSHSSQMFSIFI